MVGPTVKGITMKQQLAMLIHVQVCDGDNLRKNCNIAQIFQSSCKVKVANRQTFLMILLSE